MTSFQRAMQVFFLVFALWPAYQFYLTKAKHVDPWKLGGWAMYSTIRNSNYIEVYFYDGDGNFLAATPDLPPYQQRMLLDYKEVRRSIGQFADPAPLVDRLFIENPGAEQIELRIHLKRLDPTTDRMRVYDQSNIYWRRQGK